MNQMDNVNSTIRELVELVREIVFPEARVVFDSSKPEGTPQKLLNIDKLAGRDGKAKAYQVKQIRKIILQYKIHGEVIDV